ncbi:MAG: tetratricopeptide repeat protein [Candidatus Coatesbacteria bacterium]
MTPAPPRPAAGGPRLRGPAPLPSRPSSIPVLLALGWTLLVWLNWYRANPLTVAQVGEALGEWIAFAPGAAVVAWARNLGLLVLLAVLGLAGFGAGRPFGRWMASRGTGITASIALGSGLFGLGVLGAGLAGLAHPAVAWGTVAAAAVAGLRGWRRTDASWVFRGRCRPLAAILGTGLLIALVGSLGPEASFDGMAHHLGHPESWAARHKVFAMPWHFLASFPALLEMQYLLARLVSGTPALAKLAHFGFGLLTLAALVGWARESLEDEWALAAAAALLFIPYFMLVMMWAYVDLGAACYLTLALRLAASRGPSPVLLGVLCGFVAGTKVTGVFAVALVAGILAVRRASPARWAAFAGSFIVAVGPWGARNLLFTGNPVAPFLSGTFPTLWWGPANHVRYQRELASYNAGGATLPGVFGFLARPWDVTIRNTGCLDTRAGMGGWFLWGLPLLTLAGFVPAARIPACAALGWFLLWHLIPRQIRYLLPVWPAAALACAHAARALARRGGVQRFAAWAVAAAGLFHVPWALRMQFDATHAVRVVLGGQTAEAYLGQGMPGKTRTIAARRWWREQEGRDPGQVRDRLLVADQYGLNLFWGPRAIVQSFFDTPLIVRAADSARSPAEIGRRLRQLGIGWLLDDEENSFLMQTSYEPYAFTSAAGARWLAYWQATARLATRVEDVFYIYRLGGSAASAPPLAALPPTWPGLDQQWLAATEAEVNAAAASGRLDAAVPKAADDYGRIARETGCPAAWERRGTMLLQLGRAREAKDALLEAARRGRATGRVLGTLAVIEANAGRLAAAAPLMARALEYNPGDETNRRNLAVALARLGRGPEALTILREGLARNPGSRDLLGAWGALTGRAFTP